MENINERAIVLDMLLAVSDGQKSHIVLNETFSRNLDLKPNSRAFIKRLFNGVIEKEIFLDYVIDSFSKVKCRKLKPVVRESMRICVYELFFMDKVPSSAAVNESVKLVKKRGLAGLAPFTNGVLRNIDRKRDEIKLPADPKERISVEYSFPAWLVDHFYKEYGNEAPAIIKALSAERPVYARVNTLLTDTGSVIEELNKAGIRTEKSNFRDDFIKLENIENFDEILPFSEGKITVQDMSSGLLGLVAPVKPGDTVIDMCAAPGGKTCDLAIKAGPCGQVYAFDVSKVKTGLIKNNAERLHIDNIITGVNDASVYNPDLREKADLVLCDVPCSGLGIIARKPDIKYNASRDGIGELAAISQKILKNAVSYVKPGGTLIFSTCTMTRLENEENFASLAVLDGIEPYGFAEIFESFTDREPGQPLFNEEELSECRKGYLRLIPGRHDTDGFFISRVRKYV